MAELFAMVGMMIEEEVDRLAAQHHFEQDLKEQLCAEMKKRSSTFTEDMKAIAECLEGAPHPNEHLRVAIHEMREGTFDCGVVPKKRESKPSRSRSRGRGKAKAAAVGVSKAPRAMTLLERFG
mmetsp:Transcript_75510/g.233596  ORF Transcript_75510/g.233596 Transcript_75510/m.233596 type:complete len:123 (-) Transcript_75510:37-405(-)